MKKTLIIIIGILFTFSMYATDFKRELVKTWNSYTATRKIELTFHENNTFTYKEREKTPEGYKEVVLINGEYTLVGRYINIKYGNVHTRYRILERFFGATSVEYAIVDNNGRNYDPVNPQMEVTRPAAQTANTQNPPAAGSNNTRQSNNTRPAAPEGRAQ